MTFNLPNQVYLPPELDGKAKNIHTRMALFFDNNIYKPAEERNDTLLYQYLYHIIYMLACRARYFKRFEDYDAFAIYMATKLYLRYINPEHTEKHGKIKSVLNYCKSLLYVTKVDFQKETFCEIIGVNNKGENNGASETLRHNIEATIQDEYCNNKNINEVIIEEITALPKIIYGVVSETPYKKESELFHRIYMSTYISVLNSVTLSNSAIAKLETMNRKNTDNDALKMTMFKGERENSIILWRLEDKYYNLIHLLTTKVRKKFSSAVSGIRQELELNADDLDAVIMSAYGNVLRDDNEEF